MKKLILTMLSLYLFTMAFSQTTTSRNENSISIVEIKHDRGFSAEINYQGNYGFAFGGIIGNNLGNKTKPNYSCGIYTDIILADSIIFGPRLKLNWNYLSIFGLGVNFHNNYRSGKNDFRITPEINFSVYGLANVFLGYSFNVSKSKFSDLSAFRIGININIISKK
ncbi:MAG: hypothetical protein KA734_07560 [Fluviicola sp.]|nr:hypothetical protein [Fluviicola sp.]